MTNYRYIIELECTRCGYMWEEGKHVRPRCSEGDEYGRCPMLPCAKENGIVQSVEKQ